MISARLRWVLPIVAAVLAASISPFLLRRARFPRDAASEAQVAQLAEYVREFGNRNGRCPTLEVVKEQSVRSTGIELCAGGGVPGRPCVGYFDFSVEGTECMFRYPVGLDDFRVYLVMRGYWLDPDEFADLAEELRARKSLGGTRTKSQ